jgi:hypothetical protein
MVEGGEEGMGGRGSRGSKEKYLVVFAAKIVQNTLNLLLFELPKTEIRITSNHTTKYLCKSSCYSIS